MQYGLKGFEEKAREAKANLDLTDPSSIDKYHFYDSIFIIVDAVKTYAERFVKLATEMAETAGPERRKELLEIARICSKVPYEPAETLQKLFNLYGLSSVSYRLNQMVTLCRMDVLTNTCILCKG